MLHVTGDAVQFGNSVIQRCALCGCKIIKTRFSNDDPITRFPVYDSGTLVWMESNADGEHVPHEVDTIDNFPNITYPDYYKWARTMCTEMVMDE